MLKNAGLILKNVKSMTQLFFYESQNFVPCS